MTKLMYERWMVNVKWRLLDSKSKVAFTFKREDLLQKQQVGNYCSPLPQLVVCNVTTVHFMCVCIARSWVTTHKAKKLCA